VTCWNLSKITFLCCPFTRIAERKSLWRDSSWTFQELPNTMISKIVMSTWFAMIVLYISHSHVLLKCNYKTCFPVWEWVCIKEDIEFSRFCVNEFLWNTFWDSKATNAQSESFPCHTIVNEFKFSFLTQCQRRMSFYCVRLASRSRVSPY